MDDRIQRECMSVCFWVEYNVWHNVDGAWSCFLLLLRSGATIAMFCCIQTRVWVYIRCDIVSWFNNMYFCWCCTFLRVRHYPWRMLSYSYTFLCLGFDSKRYQGKMKFDTACKTVVHCWVLIALPLRSVFRSAHLLCHWHLWREWYCTDCTAVVWKHSTPSAANGIQGKRRRQRVNKEGQGQAGLEEYSQLQFRFKMVEHEILIRPITSQQGALHYQVYGRPTRTV